MSNRYWRVIVIMCCKANGGYLMDRKYNSILIGNGLDIQVGGDDYLNKWIIVRLLAKAKMGKYDELFIGSQNTKPLITGDEIIELFNNMLKIANKACENKYKDLTENYGDADLLETLNDFKKDHTCKIRSIEEIGMEDWLLIILLFLIEQEDLLDQYELIKEGFERMIFDAIYCEGNIQRLYLKMNKLAKLYFSNFDTIFTLNYDNTIEKLTKRTVYHLHGDFETKYHSENPKNALGFLRLQKGENVLFPPQFKHCYCTNILDFSGYRKYNYATRMTKAFIEFEKLKETVKENEDKLKKILERTPVKQREIVKIGIENNLHYGHDYHFQDFEQMKGTLSIIGLAPQNDSHIFSCINKSNIDNVIFYHYFGNKNIDEIELEIKEISLPINKPYVIKDVNIIWDEIKVRKPNKQKYTLSEIQLGLLNAFSPQKTIDIDEISWQMSSIPTFTKKAIFEMLNYEISKSKYRTTPKTKEELFENFIEFGKTLEVAAISPQALYLIYITGLQSDRKKRYRKNKRRRRKK